MYAILNKQPDSTPIDDSALEFFGRQSPAITYTLTAADPSNITVLLNGSLQMPLPFKTDFKLTDNRSSILITSKNMMNNIQKDPEKIKKCQLAMQKNIDHQFVEEITQK